MLLRSWAKAKSFVLRKEDRGCGELSPDRLEKLRAQHKAKGAIAQSTPAETPVRAEAALRKSTPASQETLKALRDELDATRQRVAFYARERLDFESQVLGGKQMIKRESNIDSKPLTPAEKLAALKRDIEISKSELHASRAKVATLGEGRQKHVKDVGAQLAKTPSAADIATYDSFFDSDDGNDDDSGAGLAAPVASRVAGKERGGNTAADGGSKEDEKVLPRRRNSVFNDDSSSGEEDDEAETFGAQDLHRGGTSGDESSDLSESEYL